MTRRMRFTEKLAKKAYRVGSSIIEIDIYTNEWNSGDYDSTIFSFKKSNNDTCLKTSYGRYGKVVPTAYVSYPALNEKIKVAGDLYPMTICELLDAMDRIGYRCKDGRNDARFFFDISKKIWYVTDWATDNVIYSIKQE